MDIPLARLVAGGQETGDVVASDSLRFTTAAGFASAVTAIVSGLVAVLDKITALDVDENIKIALLGVVGAGIVGWSIASAGDVLARAYATSHVHPKEGDQDPRPAIEVAAATLAEGFTKGLTASSTSAKRNANEIAAVLKELKAGPALTEVGVPITLLDEHENQCTLLALRLNPATPQETECLVSRPGRELEWEPLRSLQVPRLASA
jgi:uncharacterized protein YejL (UPF0352 family)